MAHPTPSHPRTSAGLLTWLGLALLWIAPVARAQAPVALAAATSSATSSATSAATSSATPAATPSASASAAEPRFDLSVNNAPATQVFLQLGHSSDWQVLVHPEVSGNLSLTLRQTTVPEALEALRDLYGYDFRLQPGRRAMIQPNTPQTRLFKVNYLRGRRQGTSDLRVSSSSITQASPNGGGAGNGMVNGSGSNNGNNATGGTMTSRPNDTAQVQTSSDADFWRDVQTSLIALLNLGEGPDRQRRSVVINASAGVIVVRALPAELRQVEAYLQAIQVSIERQVMIEAKILEVELASDAQSGVNWAAFGRLLGGAVSVGLVQPGVTLAASGALNNNGTAVTAGSTLAAADTGRGFYGMAFQSSNFAALLSFLDTQGKVSVLSSPRVATLNNQKAVLKVGSDELYVTGVSSTTTSSGSSSTTTPTVVLQPFFSGIALDVTPQIDSDGQVMLHVHPAVSTVSEKQKKINLGSLGNYQLPLATSAVNETDSIVRVKDGHIVAIGGLMRQERALETTAVPGAGELPVVGGLFRQKSDVMRKRELVILMKPTVIRTDDNWPEADGQVPRSQVQPFDEAGKPR